MREEKGITLISLVIYIIGLIVIMSVVGTLMSFYNNNVIKLNDTSDVNMELSKFTAKMIEATKEAGNAITEIAGTTIKFSNGNIYTYQDNKIYENSIVVSQHVKEFLAELETDGNKQILRIYIVLEKGNSKIEKNLSYVIEDAKGQVAIIGPTYRVNVEKGVYGNLYKISDTEYHLIFNSTGNIAKGYTEEQLVEKGTDIKDGIDTSVEISEGVFVSSQPWGPYSENITKVKIEEKIKPRSTARYFLGLSEITEIEGIANVDTSVATNMSNTFRYCNNLTNLNLKGWDTSNVTNMDSLFSGCNNLTSVDVGNWNTSNVRTMVNLFCDCWNLTSVDVSDWNTGKVKDMQGTFARCYELENIDVSDWNTGSVTNMLGVFWDCNNLTSIDVSRWETSNVTSMSFLFSNCNNLTNINVSNWNVSNVTSMGALFNGCNNLINIDVDNWNTSNVTSMVNLFCDCWNLIKVDVRKWNTGMVESMEGMFGRCYKLETIDVSSWDTSRVTNMKGMFYRCNNLSKIYAGNKWNTSAVTLSTSMFYGCTALSGVISYDSTKTDATYANYIDGYLTRSVAQNCVYFEDFNDDNYSNYTYANATVTSCTNSILTLNATSGDPKVYITLPESKYFNPKEYRYLHVRYKVTSNTRMEFFMVPNPIDQTYSISQTITADGGWHTAVFDLSTNSSVWGLSQITGMRFDPVSSSGVTIEIDYIGISSVNE